MQRMSQPISRPEYLVGVVLRGLWSELPALEEACALAVGRYRGLVVFAERPPAPAGLLLAVGIEPSQVRLDGERAQRRTVRRMMDAVEGETLYSLTLIDRPIRRTAVRQALSERCGTLVFAAESCNFSRRRMWGLARKSGVKVIVVPNGPCRSP